MGISGTIIDDFIGETPKVHRKLDLLTYFKMKKGYNAIKPSLTTSWLIKNPDQNARAHKSVKETAITAEKLGYDSIWIFDHFSSILWNEIMECWTTLTWVASLTKTIRLGTMVLCPLYRHPSLLAKMASTLDVISNGRLELGIGACAPFNELMETKPRGLKWAGPKTRIQILEETIQICKVRARARKEHSRQGLMRRLMVAYLKASDMSMDRWLPPLMARAHAMHFFHSFLANFFIKINTGSMNHFRAFFRETRL